MSFGAVAAKRSAKCRPPSSFIFWQARPSACSKLSNDALSAMSILQLVSRFSAFSISSCETPSASSSLRSSPVRSLSSAGAFFVGTGVRGRSFAFASSAGLASCSGANTLRSGSFSSSKLTKSESGSSADSAKKNRLMTR